MSAKYPSLGKIARLYGWKRAAIVCTRRIYIQLVLRRKSLVRKFPFQRPAALILSSPRSGSSWVGEVLNASPRVGYMFEPVNFSFLRRFGYGLNQTTLDAMSDDEYCRFFRKVAAEAFEGYPPAGYDCILGLSRFFWFSRSRRRLLIKEVTPGAARFYVDQFSPQVLLLLRHPAAVADSYNRLGWRGKLGWREFGFEYGRLMRRAVEAMKGADAKIIFYEQLANDPEGEFPGLFEFLNIPVPENFKHVLTKYCRGEGDSFPFETRRISTEQIDKWKKNLDPDAVKEIHAGYLDSGLEYYRGEEDWMI